MENFIFCAVSVIMVAAKNTAQKVTSKVLSNYPLVPNITIDHYTHQCLKNVLKASKKPS